MDDTTQDRRAKDLLRAGELTPPPMPGARISARLARREGRRPVGNSPRLWLRVSGADPFEDLRPQNPHGDPVSRKTVYVDGRFVRIDQQEKDAARKKAGFKASPPPVGAPPSKPSRRKGNQGESLIPAAFRNIPTATPTAPSTPRAPNQGESLIPPGFRNIPTAAPSPSPKPARPANQGESLIPPGFRNIPTAAPKAAPPTAKPPNQGESLIPPGFRNIPVASPTPPPRDDGEDRPKNLGEALIPEAFRNIPFAKPTAPPRPKRPAPPPASESESQATTRPGRPARPGRMARTRTRRVIRRPKTAASTPDAAPSAETPPAPLPKVERPVIDDSPKPRPGPEPQTLDDLFQVPAERIRLGRRRRPAPAKSSSKKDDD